MEIGLEPGQGCVVDHSPNSEEDLNRISIFRYSTNTTDQHLSVFGYASSVGEDGARRVVGVKAIE